MIDYKTIDSTLLDSVKELLTLRDISGSNDKKVYLGTIGNGFTKYLLKVLNDNSYALGIKKLQDVGKCTETNRVTYTSVIDLIEKLNTSNINDNLRTEVLELLSKCDLETQEVLTGVFQKTLKLGVTSNSINQVWSNFISVFKCPLASPMKDSNIAFPCKLDLKYDGVRCIAKVQQGTVQLYTRQGKRMRFPRVEREILRLVGKDVNIVIDGELELRSDGRTGVSGICNKNQKTGYTPDQDVDMVYYIFDVVSLEAFEDGLDPTDQYNRGIKLSSLFMLCHELRHLEQAETHICHSIDKVKEIVDAWIAAGYEGGIVKDLSAPYTCKRTNAWLKQKAINSATLKVIGTTEGSNKRKGKVGALLCESSCQKLVVHVGSGLSDDDVEAVTKTDPRGLFVEVLFNVVIKGKDSDTYSLFLPRLKKDDWVRIDKTEADSLDKLLNEHIGRPEI